LLQPDIYISGIRIQEPVTVLTDFLVAAVCFYAFFKLRKSGRKERPIFYFKYFFLAMGLSTFFGALLGHAFLYKLGFVWKTPAWVTGMCSVFFIERAAIMQARSIMNQRVSKFFSFMNVMELCTFLFLALYFLNFFFVDIHASYGLLVVFVFECFIYIKKKDPGSLMMMFAIGVSTLAAVVHMSKFSIHTWFNYFDLSHVFMAAGSYLFYLGATKIKFEETEVK